MRLATFLMFLLVSIDCFATRYVELHSSDVQELNVSISGKDLSIDFREKIALASPVGFKSYFRAQVVDNVLFLKAIKKTERSFRIIVKTPSGQFLFNVNQVKVGQNEPIKITKLNPKKAKKSRKVTKALSAIELVRFTSQQLYAPTFAQENFKNITAIPHGLPSRLDWIYSGGGLELSPIVSFKSGALTVTALKAKNKSKFIKHNLDMKKFFGRIDALNATPHHKVLGILEEDNSTAIYIVSMGGLLQNLKTKGVY